MSLPFITLPTIWVHENQVATITCEPKHVKYDLNQNMLKQTKNLIL